MSAPERMRLPVLPLKETVVFPESMTPLAVGQERSVKLIDDVVSGERMLALFAVRNPEADPPGWDDLYRVGTVAIVHKMIKVPDGTLRILVQGLQRVRMVEPEQEDPYLTAELEELPDVLPESPEVEALTRNVQSQFAHIIGMTPYLPEELQLAAANVEDPSALCHLIASTLRLKTDERQELLETVNVEERLRAVSLILNREVEMSELGSKIQSQVASEIDKGQREFFLRQQLKAIQDELGEGDEQQAEINELRGLIEEKKLPEHALKAATRELARLEKLPPAAAEYGVIRTYLDWIISLPWTEQTTDDLDLDRARQILDEDHFDLEKVKERIIEYLAVSKLKNDLSGPDPLLRRAAGRRQDLARAFDRPLGRSQVRADLRRRRPGRVRDPRPPPHVHRLDAGHDPARDPRRRVVQSGLPDRRDRQDGRRLPRRPRVGDARGARSRAALELPRPLPRPAVRSLEGALHLHGEHARHDSGAAARPDGRDPALRLHLRGEAGDRQALPGAEAAQGARPQAHEHLDPRQDAPPRDRRVHARGRRQEPRPADRGALPQGRDPDREGPHGEGQGGRGARAGVARAPPLLVGGPPADRGRRRRDRPRVHHGRRRRPLHRGDRLSGPGAAEDHGPARRGDAGVGAGGALVGAIAHRRARRRAGVVHHSTTSTSTSRRGRCRRTARRQA